MIRQGQMKQEFQKVSFTMFMTQLKGMINMPFLYPQYISEVLHSFRLRHFYRDVHERD